MEQIVKVIHGSVLYGTNTTTSDVDYKSVYMPSIDDLILRGPRSSKNLGTKGDGEARKNTAVDVDHMSYSFMTFINMLSLGELISTEMLFAKPIETSPIWDELVDNRELFLSKTMPGCMGYLKKVVNSPFDRKQCSHAVRVCWQLEELFLTGKIKFPLIIDEANKIVDIKNGTCLEEHATRLLSNEYGHMLEAQAQSNLPDHIDRVEIEDFVVDLSKRYYGVS